MPHKVKENAATHVGVEYGVDSLPLLATRATMWVNGGAYIHEGDVQVAVFAFVVSKDLLIMYDSLTRWRRIDFTSAESSSLFWRRFT